MKLLSYLEARADRRDSHRFLLIERGLDWRSLMCQGVKSFDSRLLIAATIIGLFAAAFFRETDKDTRNLMVGALIAAFAGAWGFYLGSSNNANKADDRAEASTALAHEALKQTKAPERKPDVELEPGQSATVAAAEDERTDR